MKVSASKSGSRKASSRNHCGVSPAPFARGDSTSTCTADIFTLFCSSLSGTNNDATFSRHDKDAVAAVAAATA